jgi:hypothetical protein
MTRFTKTANGKYNIQGKVYELLSGTRAQVWHGTAYKTSGGLTKKNLFQNKNGRIVSKTKHASSKKEMRLLKFGYGTKKGKFGFVKVTGKSKKNNKKMKGGNGVNYALSPSHISGISKTSGVELQFMAGNATS